MRLGWSAWEGCGHLGTSLITQHGRASAVLVSAATYERTQRELEILRVLAKGDADMEAGAGYDLDVVAAEVDERLNLVAAIAKASPPPTP
jgi:hypothetical protein